MEGSNKLLKNTMSMLLKATGTDVEHWTSCVTAAVALLNKKDKAAYGPNSSPDLIADGLVHINQLLLHAEDAELLDLPQLKEHAHFLQKARTEVRSLNHCCFPVSPHSLRQFALKHHKKEEVKRRKRADWLQSAGLVAGQPVRYYVAKSSKRGSKRKLDARPFYRATFVALVGETYCTVQWVEPGPLPEQEKGQVTKVRVESVFALPKVVGLTIAAVPVGEAFDDFDVELPPPPESEESDE